jgi:hypothetical protein
VRGRGGASNRGRDFSRKFLRGDLRPMIKRGNIAAGSHTH